MKNISLLIASAFLVLSCASQKISLDGKDDPHLWLEEVEGEKPLSWVKEQNQKTLTEMLGSSRQQKLEKNALKILQNKEKIPYVSTIGDHLYNFWQDEKHVKGLWRRTTLSSYRKKNPQWETVLDLDKLSAKEKESWVFQESTCLAPEYERCMLALSRGGKDASEWREFNIKTKKFVKDGFFVKEAKSSVAWLDVDNILVATDYGKDTMTESGYPREIRIWKRGGKEISASLRTADKKDMVVFPSTNFDGKKNVTLLSTWQNFYSATHALYEDGKLFEFQIPRSSKLKGVFRDHILVSLKEDWSVPGLAAKQGALVAVSFATAKSGEIKQGDVKLLMPPAQKGTVLQVGVAKNRVLVNVLENVKGQIYFIDYAKGEFKKPRLMNFDKQSHVTLSDVSNSKDNFFFMVSGFLSPDSLFYYSAATGESSRVKALPAQFNSQGMVVQQRWATSNDGTKVPYFLVGKKTVIEKGKAPTLLYGYGGFEVSLSPSYRPLVGKLWLENGGLYVLANIRGGGEFGPGWHQAALKTNRQKAFDDFISVGEDLVKNSITTKDKLAIQGGSNGGLLVGTVMTQRPDLFKAVLCYVPLLDMIRYSQLLAGASWMGEYGDPRKSEMREYLYSYSPYHNVSAEKEYPELFLITSTKDDRVHPGHARKFAAKLMNLGHKNLHYFENTEGGHKASADLKQKAQIRAMSYEFLFKTIYK